jgi:hypothetical protein
MAAGRFLEKSIKPCSSTRAAPLQELNKHLALNVFQDYTGPNGPGATHTEAVNAAGEMTTHRERESITTVYWVA